MEPTPHNDEAMRAELLARLGLPPTAGPGHIEAAYRAANALLDRLPAEESTFVAGQRAELDAMRSLLLEDASQASASAPAAAVAAPVPADGVTPESVGVEEASARRGGKKALVLGAAALVLVAGGAGAFMMMHQSSVPGVTGTPTNTAAATATNKLDQAKVAALMQKITSNPKDFTSYMGLANLYFQAGDYANTALFTSHALKLKPNSVEALVADGAANYNNGQTKIAQADWTQAIKLDPKNIEAHYDLGFVYMTSKTPNMAKVKSEWETVVKLAPNSAIAKNVKTHLASLTAAGKSSSSTTGQ